MMFGITQKRTKAAAKPLKLHSIAAVMRGRGFAGRFEVSGVSYSFTFAPTKAAVAGRRLQLTGNLTVTDGRPNARALPHSLNNVRATLISTQGGIGTAPPRQKLPADLGPTAPDLPVIESTGALSFCGVLYFRLSPLVGRALGVAADMSELQLNVRLAPTVDGERTLQAVYSSIVEALFGGDANAATEHVGELNTLIARQ